MKNILERHLNMPLALRSLAIGIALLVIETILLQLTLEQGRRFAVPAALVFQYVVLPLTIGAMYAYMTRRASLSVLKSNWMVTLQTEGGNEALPYYHIYQQAIKNPQKELHGALILGLLLGFISFLFALGNHLVDPLKDDMLLFYFILTGVFFGGIGCSIGVNRYDRSHNIQVE